MAESSSQPTATADVLIDGSLDGSPLGVSKGLIVNTTKEGAGALRKEASAAGLPFGDRPFAARVTDEEEEATPTPPESSPSLSSENETLTLITTTEERTLSGLLKQRKPEGRADTDGHRDVNLEESSSVLTEGGSDDQRDSTDSASFSIQSLEFSDGLPAAGSSLDIEDGLSSSCPAPGVESFPVSTDVPSLKEDEAPEAAGGAVLAATASPPPHSDAAAAAAAEPRPPIPAYYLVKWITWKEKKTPIITQSENGPCPLLAIMNTLFLRWKAKLPAQTEMVTTEELMAHLGDCVLSAEAKRRPRDRKTCLCFSAAGLFPVILTMFVLLTASHLQTTHVEAVQAGDVVVMLGSSAILPCHISTNDRLSQITWQKTIKGKAPNDVFLIIQPKNGLKYSNEKDLRFEFIGNVDDKNGTLKFSNVTLEDEGSYTCIFSLFPGGTPSRNTQLVILVPPITNLMDYTPLEGNEEVPLATCTAAASKPKADVRWIKGSLEGKVREEINETRHANGTTTTWSTLLGKPGRQMNGQLVKCVISSEATKEVILQTHIQVHYPPGNVNIVERSEVSYECETEANPKATVTWTRSGQPLPPSVEVVGATLQFSSQSNDLSGLYKCETTNPYGSKQAYFFVHFSSGNCNLSFLFTGLLILLILLLGTGKLQSILKRFQSDPRGDAKKSG